ncbi:MAG: Glutaredoxin [uncultured bacterium]|nr:MAG: Glutaredoxin [uncultured bacterium]
MQITVYSTTTCPYCKMLKDYLKAKGASYQEKIVDQDEVARGEMSDKSGGFLGVPFTVIVKDDGGEEKVLGFDKGKIDSILGV